MVLPQNQYLFVAIVLHLAINSAAVSDSPLTKFKAFSMAYSDADASTISGVCS